VEAAQLLLDLLNSDEREMRQTQKVKVLKGNLLVRNSTSAPPVNR